MINRTRKRLPTSQVPDEISELLRELGKQWALAASRPHLDRQAKQHWDELIQEWADSDMPLIIRKSEKGMGRGCLITHSSGRRLVLADNSPAQWAFSRAYNNHNYSLAEIQKLLEEDLIPFTMVVGDDEKKTAFYKCSLSVVDNVNRNGWKLCHSHPIGLNAKVKAEHLPIHILKQHFTSFLAPSNHFLVPKVLGGMGEIAEIIEEVRKLDCHC